MSRAVPGQGWWRGDLAKIIFSHERLPRWTRRAWRLWIVTLTPLPRLRSPESGFRRRPTGDQRYCEGAVAEGSSSVVGWSSWQARRVRWWRVGRIVRFVIEAPSGTVTFLFTDIEGSTRLWEEFPDAMRAALADHDEVVRDAIVSCGGYVVKTTGDGFHTAFGDASSAVRAAVAAQLGLDAHVWPATGPLRVRMGIDTGEADERDGDYFGRPVNRAARLMAAAHGGQIVASAATAAVLTAPSGVALVDQGFHRLRGLAEPMQVFRVHADGLVVVDQPLDTEQTVPGNLPRLATEYVGRVDLLRSQAAELASRRLVTLTGTGGVGKTRTAYRGWLVVGGRVP